MAWQFQRREQHRAGSLGNSHRTVGRGVEPRLPDPKSMEADLSFFALIYTFTLR